MIMVKITKTSYAFRLLISQRKYIYETEAAI